MKNPCFCPKCVADFSAEYGEVFDRETLVRAIGRDEKVRRAFDAFRRSKYTALAKEIETDGQVVAIGYERTKTGVKVKIRDLAPFEYALFLCEEK